MEFLLKPTWFVPFGILLSHQIIQYGFGWSIPFLDAYLDPFLSIPVLLGLIQAERQLFFDVPRLSGLEIIVLTLALSLLFEEIFPRYQPAFVRDGWDYLFYGLGAGYFFCTSIPSRT